MVYTITVHLRANSDPSSVEKLKAKLIEASRIYSQDKETISWFVMQSTSDPRDFTIVERYEQESVSLSRTKRDDFNIHNINQKFGRQRCTSFIKRILTPTQPTEPEIPPRKPVLEDIRPLRHSFAGKAHGPAPLRGAGHQQGRCCSCLGIHRIVDESV